MITYALDTKLAKQADAGGYISETGKYIGEFKNAFQVISGNKGTYGIEFAFESEIGEKANYLTLWTHSSSLEPIYGAQLINATMAVLKLRGLTMQKGQATDHTGQPRTVDIFPELINRKIGLLLQKEEYLKSDNSIGHKFNIINVFDPDTELTASEILDRKTEPKLLAQHVSRLKDKLLPANKVSSQSSGYQPPSSGGLADMSDDIPFAPLFSRNAYAI